jgi:hypothetical protein
MGMAEDPSLRPPLSCTGANGLQLRRRLREQVVYTLGIGR